MKQFKIRASATSKIMAYADKKDCPVGAITYLHEWIKEQLYDRKNIVTSKYFEKGIECESEAIEFAAKYYGWGMVAKNEQHFENSFMTGTPDLILANEVPDIKNSFSPFTFPLLDAELDKAYWWQLQTYMALTGKEKGSIIYCLMDTPDSIVEAEARMQMYQRGMTDLPLELFDEVKASMTYSNLPDQLRIKRFDVVRDDKAIKQIEQRVTACNDYIASLNLSQYEHSLKKSA